MINFPTPWHTIYHDPGESMGYPGRVRIVAADGTIVTTLPTSNDPRQNASYEDAAALIVSAVNSHLRS